MEKTKQKKSDSESDLNEMREAFRKHKEKPQGGGGGSNDWDKLGDGKNMRRFLPRPNDKKFYTEGWTHFNVGPNTRALRCIDEEHVDPERGLPTSGTKCPSCKKFLREQARINSEYAKGDKEGHEEWKKAKDKYVPRHQYYANVLVEDENEDVEVKILAFGTQVWSQLLNYYLGDDTTIGDFTAIKSGRWMNVKKEKKAGRDRRNVEYKVFPASDSTSLTSAWGQIKEALHDLDAAPGKVLSKEEFEAVMKGVDVSKSKDDEEDDDEAKDGDGADGDSDEEEEEDRPVNKTKLGSKIKKRRDDD